MRPAATEGDAPRNGTPGGGSLEPLLPLLREVGDLKRTCSAGREGTALERLFRRSWAALLSGEGAEAVALRETALAVAAARMGDRDVPMLVRAGLSHAEALAVLEGSFDSVARPIPEGLRGELRAALAGASADDVAAPALPFVDALARQPRAGATAPGKPRILLEPPESHAEHCAAVAVYGALLAPLYGTRPGGPFLLGLAHHLHNALFPDSGFAGDELLGEHLDRINGRLRDEVLRGISARNEALGAGISALLPLVDRADTPEARAFQAADVLDRVLQQEHYARAASFTLDDALGEMDLVHEGPTQSFHLEVLDAAGIGR